MKNILPVIFLTAIFLFALSVTIHTGEAAASGSFSTVPQDSDNDRKLIAGTDDTLDSFSDGDFTATPVWSGNTSSFTVVTNSDAAAGATGSQTLRLNAPATTGTMVVRAGAGTADGATTTAMTGAAGATRTAIASMSAAIVRRRAMAGAIAATASACGWRRCSSARPTGSPIRGNIACRRLTAPIAGSAITTTRCWSMSPPAMWSTRYRTSSGRRGGIAGTARRGGTLAPGLSLSAPGDPPGRHEDEITNIEDESRIKASFRRRSYRSWQIKAIGRV